MSTIMNITEEDIDNPEKCRKYTVSIVECSKVGVTHACLFTAAGFKVMGVSTNPHIFELLKKGRTPFSEKEYLVLERRLKEGLFTACSDVRKAASESDVILIAIQTSVDIRKKPDYSMLERVCKEVGMGLKKGSLILFVSVTGPGVVENSMREILEKSSGLKAGVDFGLASSPVQTSWMEKADDPAKFPRIVGAFDELSLRVASLVLGKLSRTEIIGVSNIRTAEALNLFQNINSEISKAAANELAFLCERLRIDFSEVLETAEKARVFHLPPPGIINGSARRDFYLLREEAENVNLDLRLTRMARRINDEIAKYTFRQVKDALKVCGKTVRRSKISVLGVSRRPNAKEPPEALTKSIIKLLKSKVRVVQVYDPFFTKKELTEFGFEAEKLSKVVEKTDCLVILAAHSKFGRLNLRKVKLLAKKSPAIVDISHVINPVKAEKNGFVYRGLCPQSLEISSPKV